MPTCARTLIRLALVAAVTAGCVGAGEADDDATSEAPSPTEEPTSAGTGPWATDDWESVAPAEVDLDATVLDEMATAAEDASSTCLVVVRDGQIAGEWYWNDGSPTQTEEVFSVTKSLTSILVGTAQDEGELDVSDSASTWIPEWRDTPAEQVAVRNLLSNDSGRYWEFRNDYAAMGTADDRTAFAVGLEQTEPPGQAWAYNNSAIQTLEAVLSEATGQQLPELAEDRLFEPLGMDATHFTTDPSGNGLTYAGVQSTCRDLARFGLMVLHEGRWGDDRIVSADWIEASTGAASTELNGAYGYLWWLNREGHVAGPVGFTRAADVAAGTPRQLVPNRPDDLVWAQGLGGQVIQVHEASDTVVVRLGIPGSGYGSADTARVLDAIVEP